MQHLGKGLVRADAFDLDVIGQVELQLFRPAGLLFAAAHIGDAIDGHAVMVGEDTADPDRRRHLVFRITDALADQVFRFVDAGGGVDVDAGVAKEAAWKNRNRDKRTVRFEQRDGVGGQRHFRRLELLVAQHAEEGLFDRHVEVIQIDPVRLHAAVHKRAGAVIIPAAQR